MDYIITTEQLTKKYKNFISVNHVSLHIRKGSIYGFLGPNGAGKSTTMKMLLGLTAPTKGSFTIDGKQFPNDRIAILKEIGSFIEAPSFYANLTGRENLDIIRRILGLPKADVEDALELVGLTEFGDRLAKKYSLGMKQRLGLAGALLGRPPILILDEPTNGLDPSGIHEIRNLVKSLPSLYDCTVLISSHMLPMDCHQRNFRNIQTFPEQIDSYQHIKYIQTHVPNNLGSLQGINIRVKIFHPDSQILHIVCKILSHSLSQSSDQDFVSFLYFLINLSYQIIDLTLYWPYLNHRVQKSCRADDLLCPKELVLFLIVSRSGRYGAKTFDCCFVGI